MFRPKRIKNLFKSVDASTLDPFVANYVEINDTSVTNCTKPTNGSISATEICISTTTSL